MVRAFWENEFATWKPQYRAEAIAPIQNKIGQFLSMPILRAIVGQARSRLDLRRVMDNGQILIVNLSKGRIGEDGSTLLGSLLVSGIQFAAMSRADVPEKRPPRLRPVCGRVPELRHRFLRHDPERGEEVQIEPDWPTSTLPRWKKPRPKPCSATWEACWYSRLGHGCRAARRATGRRRDAADYGPAALSRPMPGCWSTGCPAGHSPSRRFPLRSTMSGRRAAIVRRTSRHRYARPVNQVHAEIDKVFASAA